jgi:integrase/recombinase XerD
LQRAAKALHRRTYIYTDTEIVKLLETARTFPSPMSSLRPLSLYTMIVLAYCAGLRIREIVNLTVGDVSLEDATIEIRNTKFFKSRRLPMAPSAMKALKTYLKERAKVGAPTVATAGLFWHQKANRRYSYVTTHALLVKVLRRSGIKPAKGKVGPRIHDLRHAMVCNRMLTWYKDGVNPQSRLAHLATFMGHRDVNSTLVYLTVTPKLLQLASSRFREHGKRALSTEEHQS